MVSIISANPDTFDAFLVVAVILFILGAVIAVTRTAVVEAITLAGLASFAFAFLFLT